MIRAFHGNPAIKTNLIIGLEEDFALDNIIHGSYSNHSITDDGKGCAVGCTLKRMGWSHRDDHHAYEVILGIPEELAWLQDFIFERMSRPVSTRWAINFFSAIEPGADLSKVWLQLSMAVLTDKAIGFTPLLQTMRERLLAKWLNRLLTKVYNGETVEPKKFQGVMEAADSIMGNGWESSDRVDALRAGGVTGAFGSVVAIEKLKLLVLAANAYCGENMGTTYTLLQNEFYDRLAVTTLQLLHAAPILTPEAL